MRTRLCLIQTLAIDWMQEMQVRKDKMKGPMAGIGKFEKGDDLRVQLTSLNLGLNLRAVRGPVRAESHWQMETEN